jgi:hypothetical protein
VTKVAVIYMKARVLLSLFAHTTQLAPLPTSILLGPTSGMAKTFYVAKKNFVWVRPRGQPRFGITVKHKKWFKNLNFLKIDQANAMRQNPKPAPLPFHRGQCCPHPRRIRANDALLRERQCSRTHFSHVGPLQKG